MQSIEIGGAKCVKCGAPLYVGCGHAQTPSTELSTISDETAAILFGNGNKGPKMSTVDLGYFLADQYARNTAEFLRKEVGVDVNKASFEKTVMEFRQEISAHPELANGPMDFNVGDSFRIPGPHETLLPCKVVKAEAGHYIIEAQMSPNIYAWKVVTNAELKTFIQK